MLLAGCGGGKPVDTRTQAGFTHIDNLTSCSSLQSALNEYYGNRSLNQMSRDLWSHTHDRMESLDCPIRSSEGR